MKTLNRALKLCGETRNFGASKTLITILETDVDNNVTRCSGITKPVDADAGYAKGCFFIDTDAASGSIVYTNDGTIASCDFNLGVSGDITSVVAGAGMTGGGTTGAVTLNVVNHDGKITVGADTIDITAASLTQADIVAPSAVTATTDGLSTGIIPATAFYVTVTSDSADKVVTLPASVVGKTVMIYVGATGFELRTTAASSIKINDVISGSTNEAAIPATSICTCTCVSATEWVLTAADKLGAVITAIAPDAVA